MHLRRRAPRSSSRASRSDGRGRRRQSWERAHQPARGCEPSPAQRPSGRVGGLWPGGWSCCGRGKPGGGGANVGRGDWLEARERQKYWSRERRGQWNLRLERPTDARTPYRRRACFRARRKEPQAETHPRAVAVCAGCGRRVCRPQPRSPQAQGCAGGYG